MKKKLIVVIIALLLILPSAVAVANYVSTANQPANKKNTTRIIVTDLDNVPHLLERKADGDEVDRLISLICDINDNARDNKLPALPDAVAAGKYFRIVLSTVSKDDEYHYYMSTDPELCYISMPDGVICRPDAEDVYAFLETSFAETLYESATPPTLTVSGEFQISPVSSDWSYKNYTGEYVKSTAVEATDEKQETELVGGLSVDFDHAPDWCNIKVTTADGEEIFNDTSDKLADLRITESIDATVEIAAKWYELEDRDSFGESTYSFEARLNPPVSFYMPKATAENSRFVTLSAKNVTDVSKIVYKCEPDLGTTPKFYIDGDWAHALLAIPADAIEGEYKITLTYGAASQELFLKLERKAYTPAEETVDDATYAAACSESAINEFNELVKTLAADTSDERYFDGAFGGYFDDRILYAPISTGYGRKITFNGDSSKTLVNEGVDYSVAAGTNVSAVADGKVVYVGNLDFTGNLVVVDHGWGLKSWYWNLGSTSVSVGDTIKKNGVLGTAGNTGLFYGTTAGVHIALSVGENFVCPYQTWYNGDGGVALQGVLDIAQ